MNPDTLILAATVIGLLLNAFAVLQLAWRGGNILGRLDTTMGNLSIEVATLRSQTPAFEKAVILLNEVEKRVTRLENAKGFR